MGDRVLAFDVGGAAIKAADGLGWTCCEAFELWRRPSELAAAVSRMAEGFRPARIVATMTGEIADCYPARAAGVGAIVAALESAAAAVGADLGIYLVDGSIVLPQEARARPLEAAASNWHALARLAGRFVPNGRALLVDVGSTTTDLIPIVSGRPAPRATDDVGRMASGELVYTGVERTPVAAIVRSLPWRGMRRPVASERYADSRDVWLLLGGLPEDPRCLATADGRPATIDAARARLARMLLADPDAFTLPDATAAAEWCGRVQSRQVARSLRKVVGSGAEPSPQSLVITGHGECLARRAVAAAGLAAPIVALAKSLGAEVSRVAPAHALALVARGAIA